MLRWGRPADQQPRMYQAQRQRRPRGDLRQRQHPPCPRRHRLPGRSSPPGAALSARNLHGTSARGGNGLPIEIRAPERSNQDDPGAPFGLSSPAPNAPSRRSDHSRHQRLSHCVIIAGCGVPREIRLIGCAVKIGADSVWLRDRSIQKLTVHRPTSSARSCSGCGTVACPHLSLMGITYCNGVPCQGSAWQ